MDSKKGTGSMTSNLKIPEPTSILLFLLCSLLVLSNEPKQVAADTMGGNGTFITGAIVDLGSRIGKEQKTAMEIAVQNFNARPGNLKLSIQFRNSTGDPLQAAFAAEELISESQAKAIIGTEKWQEAVLVADVGSAAQVPAILLSASAMAPPISSLQWPFLVQMANDATEQTKCLAQIVHSYQWRKVIIVYEDQPYGGDSGLLTLLNQALQQVGSEIEYGLVIPPLATLSDPNETIHQLLDQVSQHNKSRVFLVLDVSLTLARYFFIQAQKLGFMGSDSVWLMTEGIANLFSSLDYSVIQGALGIRRYYARSTKSFLDFKAQFWLKFSSEYPDEDSYEPGFYSLLAYDGILAIGAAVEESGNNATTTTILKNMLGLSFAGLSGDVKFEESRIAQLPTYEIVNVVEQELRELGFWIPGLGFSRTLGNESTAVILGESGLFDQVTWPGNLTGLVPKGWDMPSESNEMKIGLPVSLPSKYLFYSEEKSAYTGFCIELFQEVLTLLNCGLPYKFITYNDSYDNLVFQVYNKTFDAAIGDITVFSNRTNYVDFTQPFAESGLSLILPTESGAAIGWTFMRPFGIKLWFSTVGLLLYTAFIVWFLEHRINKDFQGTWGEQISTSLWFAFNSLFFSQREDIKSNYTRVVLVVWLFIVLVLTQSYNADLASTLTISRLSQNSTDIQTLLRSNAIVGCDRDSFVRGFIEDVLQFKSNNIIDLGGQPEDILNNFKDGNITAAFIELPYAKLFHYKYCDGYSIVGPLYRFGGLGFVFPKGSPIAIDISRAILTLTENGKVAKLEEKWLIGESKCSQNEMDGSSDSGEGSLDIMDFWGLFVVSSATFILCLTGSFLIPKIRKYKQYCREFKECMNGGNNGGQMLSFAAYLLQLTRREVRSSSEDSVVEHPQILEGVWIPNERSAASVRVFPEASGFLLIQPGVA